jgi:UMF1 family MFS transporter
VSARGFAYGYIGGGVLLAINLAWIAMPGRFGLAGVEAATRLSFASVGVWWLAFSIPLFRHVPERPGAGAGARDGGPRVAVASGPGAPAAAATGAPPAARAAEPALPPGTLIARSFRDLAHTLATARHHPDLFRFLLAYWLYSDGIGTIVRMSSIYGSELGIGRAHLVGALLMVQIVAAPASIGFGRLARRIGARRAIILGLLGYAAIPVYAFFISRPRDFWILAGMVAVVQGGTQALSRSLFAALAPRDRLGQMFGFYSVSEKLAGIVGPLVFGLVAQGMGSGRFAVFTLVPFFLGGAWLLATVNVPRGERAAASASS